MSGVGFERVKTVHCKILVKNKVGIIMWEKEVVVAKVKRFCPDIFLWD
jgi:hypothetical protein